MSKAYQNTGGIMNRIIALCTLLLLTFGPLLAQERSGNIYGTVVDDNQAPLPGVTVTCTSELTSPMTFITTARGTFRFLSLSPGAYAVRAELQGFTPAMRENILVETGKNVTVTLQIAPARLEEEVVVTAGTPVVDTRKTTISTNFSVDELQSLPTARDPWVILQLSPGVTLDRENVGGSASGQQSNFVSRGSGRGSTNWNLDGIDATDQVSEGASSQYYDFDSFEEIQIQTAATDVTAFTAGAQINLVTKRGSNRFSGGGRIYYTDESFQSSNTPDDFDLEEDKVTGVADTGFNIGGPIFKDKLWFWTGFGYQDIKTLDVVGAEINTQIYNFEFKINMALGKHRIETFFNFTDNPKQGRVAYSNLDAPEARYNQSGPKPIFKVQDEISVNENLFFSLKGSYAGFGFKLTPVGGFDVPAYRTRTTGAYSNTYRYGSDYGRDQYFGQVMGILFLEDFLGGNHEFKFGTEFKHSFGQRDRQYVSEYLRFRDIEARTGYRAYIYRPNSNYDYRINRFGLFAQDTLTLGRLTVLASLRYDRQWGYTNEVSVEGSNVAWAGEYNLPAVTAEAVDSNVIWNTFSPRLGLIYDITGDGKTTAKVNFGIYGDRYDSGFLSGLVSTYGYVYFNWDNKNGDLTVTPDEISRPRVSDSFSVLDPEELFDSNLVSPKVLELTAGIERELFTDFAVGGTFIYRRAYDDYWSINYVEDGDTLRLPTTDDYVQVGTIPTQYGGLPYWDYKPGLKYSTNDFTFQRPDYYEQFFGFEISFRKRYSAASPWLVTGSFTFQDWRRHYPTTDSYNDPTNVEQLDGEYAGYVSTSSGSTDQSLNPRWMAKLGFAYQLPYEINIGGTLTARDGYILRETYQEYDYEKEADDGDSPSLYTVPYGSKRLPTFAMLSLRADKPVRIDRFKITFSVDLFNLFNANTTLSQEDELSRDNYGQIIQYLKPRIFRFGMRFQF
jgi:hypothetical protein